MEETKWERRMVEAVGDKKRDENETVGASETRARWLTDTHVWAGTTQTLRHVLESCGDDLEEAIHSLQALKIAAGQCEERLLAAKTAVDVGRATNPTFPNGTTADAQAAAEGRGDAKDKQAAYAAEGRNEVERSANDWVEIVVGEMSKSVDMDDARKRAANLLEKFEQDVLQASGVERERVRQLLEENTILKRAVTIQNQRIAEAAEKDREINHLRQTLSQCQEQLHKAEMNQYALAMHLRQATGEGTLDHTRFPDVY